jgi:uncharacterized damage-inducible protein DinB
MTYYGAKDIAASYRTVRNNTLKIAEEIPEDKYGFRVAEGTRTIAQTLIHISNLHQFTFMLHRDDPSRTTMEGFNFMALLAPIRAMEQETMTKAQILDRLRSGADEFEGWVKTLSEDFLGQVITMPPGGSPPTRNRFDMIIAVKEHEMHHRGQLMLMERMIGITPHLTRAFQERMAAMQAKAEAEAKVTA